MKYTSKYDILLILLYRTQIITKFNVLRLILKLLLRKTNVYDTIMYIYSQKNRFRPVRTDLN
jgi:hypothetical protein